MAAPPEPKGPVGPPDASRARDTAEPDRSARRRGHSDDRALAPGSRLLNRFRIERVLGEGGWARVYEAFDEALGEPVALKVLRAESVSGSEAGRLADEVRLARRVTHRNVCRVHDLFEADGRFFVSMERLGGRTLRRRLRRAPNGLKPPEVLRILRDVAAGLAAAHDIGVLHRDVKPENVMLTEEGRAVLLDFGIARPLDASAGGTPEDRGFVVGTPGYMAPEQVRNEPLGPACDVWAVGVLAYEMLTGRPPFGREDATAALAAARDAEPPPLPEGGGSPTVRGQLAALIADALQKDPRARPPDGRALLRRLGGADEAGADGAADAASRAAAPAGPGPQRSARPTNAARPAAAAPAAAPPPRPRAAEGPEGPRVGWVLLGLLGVVAAAVFAYEILGPLPVPPDGSGPRPGEPVYCAPGLPAPVVLLPLAVAPDAGPEAADFATAFAHDLDAAVLRTPGLLRLDRAAALQAAERLSGAADPGIVARAAAAALTVSGSAAEDDGAFALSVRFAAADGRIALGSRFFVAHGSAGAERARVAALLAGVILERAATVRRALGCR